MTASLEDRLLRARKEILKTHGHTVDIDNKAKSLTKFGRIDSLGATETTVSQLGDETYLTANTAMKVSSSDVGDTGNINIESHNEVDDVLEFLAQNNITLNGRTPVDLPTDAIRFSRMYNSEEGTLAAPAAGFNGTVYLYEGDATVTNGVPQEADKIHLQSGGSNNQSLKCATSVSNDDYLILTQLFVSVNRQQTRSVDFRLKRALLGQAFRTIYPIISCNSQQGSIPIQLDPCIIIPPNADVLMTAISSGTGTGAGAMFGGVLASIVRT